MVHNPIPHCEENRPGGQADGGTLFLDEAGNIPPELQPKLLRTIQERTVQRIGSPGIVKWNARVISASNANLWDLVKAGKFREDLLFRLAGAEIFLPPLRERMQDLPLMAEHFLARTGGDRGRLTLSPDALGALAAYGWPGNVRELRHALERACALARGAVIDAEHLPEKVRGGPTVPAAAAAFPVAKGDVTPLDALRRRYVRHVLELCGGNKSEAARLLGIDRSTLYEILAEN